MDFPSDTCRPATLLALLDMLNLPQDVTFSNAEADAISELDPEGFTTSFSRLGAAEGKAADPVADVQDVKQFAAIELAKRSAEKVGVLGPLVGVAKESEAGSVGEFESYMAQNG